MPSKSPIHSTKHIVQVPIAAVASGAVANVTIANVVAAPDSTVASDITEGCVIKAVYVEMWYSGLLEDFTTIGIVFKRVAGSGAPSAANMDALHNFPNKKNIFQTFQGLNPANGNMQNMFKGWIKIPKGKQRMGQGDRLHFAIKATGTQTAFCGFFIYKEYT